MPIFDESLFDGGDPRIIPVPPAPPDGYLGRFQLGGLVPLSVVPVDNLGFPGVPDAAPTAAITAPDGSPVATVSLAMDGSFTLFGLPYFLGIDLPLGTYQVSYSFSVSGVPGTSSGSYDVISGGDPGGAVISMFAYDRPEARYVVAQLSSGMIVQGRNPRLEG